MASRANALGSRDWVRNRLDGSVEAVVQGKATKVNRMVEWARRGPSTAVFTSVDIFPSEGDLVGFQQRESTWTPHSPIAPSASVDMHTVFADTDLTSGASEAVDYSKNLEQNLFATESLSSVKEPHTWQWTILTLTPDWRFAVMTLPILEEAFRRARVRYEPCPFSFCRRSS